MCVPGESASDCLKYPFVFRAGRHYRFTAIVALVLMSEPMGELVSCPPGMNVSSILDTVEVDRD